MDPTALTITLSDGRTLGFAFYGSAAPTATTIFYFHGGPSSRLEAAILYTPAVALNVRIVSVDRPGMGLSTFQENREILDWPGDITELANHLNLAQFSILAYSSGALYGLACARMIPRSRLIGVEIMAGIYPLRVHGLLFLRPLRGALTAGAAKMVGSALDSQWGDLARNPDPTDFYTACQLEMPKRPEVEQRAFRGCEMVALYDPMREAFRQGGKGFGVEAKLGTSKIGFEFKEIDCDGGRVTVWHGAMDVNVSVDQASKAAATMAGADLRILNTEGHAGVLIHYGEEIMRHAVAMIGRSWNPNQGGKSKMDDY